MEAARLCESGGQSVMVQISEVLENFISDVMFIGNIYFDALNKASVETTF